MVIFRANQKIAAQVLKIFYLFFFSPMERQLKDFMSLWLQEFCELFKVWPQHFSGSEGIRDLGQVSVLKQVWKQSEHGACKAKLSTDNELLV